MASALTAITLSRKGLFLASPSMIRENFMEGGPMPKLRIMFVLAATSLVAVAANSAIGCGGSDSATPSGGNATCTGDCQCSGATCTCAQGGHCVFGGAAD